ncbi:hypothetical protein HAZT_HAZT005189 [Hyalella azteca]|uniref:Molybdate-anion transporter n=1 Tax=Hyalella azteca TaxID=294128 RepID=A0A6A0H0Z9_HYAAZ|nr:hypothetical protein HAZT_HAZT005189 [Hyalella azteca]
MEGLRTIIFKEEILYLGIVQSLFEANMYIFVFQWTPILDEHNDTPLGMVFASFMVCIMVGSSLYAILLHKKVSEAKLLTLAVIMAMVSMAICVIPEELRAGIMNWFRVPMNILTCSGLLLLHNQTMISNTESMFAICTIMLAVALVSSMRFSKLFSVVSVAADVLAHSDEKRPLNIGEYAG